MPNEIGGNHFNRISPGFGGEPSAPPLPNHETPGGGPATRGPLPAGMPGGRAGRPAFGGPAGGRPRMALMGMQDQTRMGLYNNLASGNQLEEDLGIIQNEASMQSFLIGSAQQQVNSGLHMAKTALETAIKGQNSFTDGNKDAI